MSRTDTNADLSPWTLTKYPWNQIAEDALNRSPAIEPGGLDFVRDGVRAGTHHLYRVQNHSWMVLQIAGDTLWCWCYVGKDARGIIRRLFITTREMGLKHFCFCTRWEALVYLAKRYHVACRVQRLGGQDVVYDMSTE